MHAACMRSCCSGKLYNNNPIILRSNNINGYKLNKNNSLSGMDIHIYNILEFYIQRSIKIKHINTTNLINL